MSALAAAAAASGPDWTVIATIVLAIAAILGLVFAGMAWLYKRGADERELTLSIREHSKATDNLAAKITELAQGQSALDRRVDGHETRITVAEQNIQVNARDISKLWPSPLREAIEHSAKP